MNGFSATQKKGVKLVTKAYSKNTAPDGTIIGKTVTQVGKREVFTKILESKKPGKPSLALSEKKNHQQKGGNTLKKKC